MVRSNRSEGIKGSLLGARRSNPTGVSDRAYEDLCQAIVTLELPPGSLYSAQELGEMLGASAPVIVAAAQRLSETGLVTVLPRRGVMVAPVDVLDVRQVLQARLALETKAAELAAQDPHPTKVETLRELEERLRREVADTDDFEVFLARDLEFHRMVASVSDNRFIVGALERVWTVSIRLWHVYFRQCGAREIYAQPHKPLVTAIVAGDVEAASRGMREHLSAAAEILVEGLWGSRP